MGKQRTPKYSMEYLMHIPEADRIISAERVMVAYNVHGEPYEPADKTSDFDRLINKWNFHAPAHRRAEADACKKLGHVWARVMDKGVNLNGWKVCLRCVLIRGDERIPKSVPQHPIPTSRT